MKAVVHYKSLKLMVIFLVQVQSLFVIYHEKTLTAKPLFVNVENVSREIVFTGCSVLAKGACKWFVVTVEVTIEDPGILSLPVAVGASVDLLLLLYIAGRGRWIGGRYSGRS